MFFFSSFSFSFLHSVSVFDPKIRETLLQIYQDENALPQKRVAAYLTIMREPGPALSPVIEYFNNQMQDPEVRNFVASHLANLWTYNEMYVNCLCRQ